MGQVSCASEHAQIERCFVGNVVCFSVALGPETGSIQVSRNVVFM